MASEELATVRELLRGLDMGPLSIAERRAAGESFASPPPPGTTVEPTDAGGVQAEWVIAEGLGAGDVLLYVHGRAAGVNVTIEVWDEMPHVWHAFVGLLPESTQAIERIGAWLRERWPRD
jgi:acetyl esterase/lipase